MVNLHQNLTPLRIHRGIIARSNASAMERSTWKWSWGCWTIIFKEHMLQDIYLKIDDLGVSYSARTDIYVFVQHFDPFTVEPNQMQLQKFTVNIIFITPTSYNRCQFWYPHPGESESDDITKWQIGLHSDKLRTLRLDSMPWKSCWSRLYSNYKGCYLNEAIAVELLTALNISAVRSSEKNMPQVHLEVHPLNYFVLSNSTNAILPSMIRYQLLGFFASCDTRVHLKEASWLFLLSIIDWGVLVLFLCCSLALKLIYWKEISLGSLMFIFMRQDPQCRKRLWLITGASISLATVLTNCYEGFITSLITAPAGEQEINSLQEWFDTGNRLSLHKDFSTTGLVVLRKVLMEKKLNFDDAVVFANSRNLTRRIEERGRKLSTYDSIRLGVPRRRIAQNIQHSDPGLFCTVVREPFSSSSFFMVLRLSEPYLSWVSRAANLLLWDSGIGSHWVKFRLYFGNRLKDGGLSTEPFPLPLKSHLLVSFRLFGLALLISLAVFLAELLWKESFLSNTITHIFANILKRICEHVGLSH
jgi:hypothetical protein